MPRSNPRRAFTLLECLIVVVVIAIIAAILLPMWMTSSTPPLADESGVLRLWATTDDNTESRLVDIVVGDIITIREEAGKSFAYLENGVWEVRVLERGKLELEGYRAAQTKDLAMVTVTVNRREFWTDERNATFGVAKVGTPEHKAITDSLPSLSSSLPSGASGG